MRFKLALIAAAALLLCSTPVRAQAITQVIHTVYLQGTNTVQQTATLNFPTGWSCGQKPKIPRPTVAVVNPTRIILDDPADATADCIFTDSATANGGLFSLPFGTNTYESTLKNVSSGGTSPESARSNLFTHPGAAPPAPTGTRIARMFGFGRTVLGFRTRSAGGRSRKPLFLMGDVRNSTR
jgi:hypothetical protein